MPETPARPSAIGANEPVDVQGGITPTRIREAPPALDTCSPFTPCVLSPRQNTTSHTTLSRDACPGRRQRGQRDEVLRHSPARGRRHLSSAADRRRQALLVHLPTMHLTNLRTPAILRVWPAFVERRAVWARVRLQSGSRGGCALAGARTSPAVVAAKHTCGGGTPPVYSASPAMCSLTLDSSPAASPTSTPRCCS